MMPGDDDADEEHMTYCVGLKLNAGLVLLSDTRTNAGLDNIAIYRKMFFFENPGERVIAIMTAGSLSVTQTTLARLHEAIDDEMADETTSILKAPTMLQVASMIGDCLARTRREISDQLRDLSQHQASASMIVAGQRAGGDMRMFLIYPEGNFIEATEDTPFLQIGEHKYGKPILDRVVTPRSGGRTSPRRPPASRMRRRRCCCRWTRPSARTCRWVCRWIWRSSRRTPAPSRPSAASLMATRISPG